MNIIFLTRFEPSDINNWSGTLYFIYNKLKEKNNVKVVGPEIIKQIELFSAGNFSIETFIPTDRYVKNIGVLLSERIKSFNFDLIFFGDLLFIPEHINIPYILLSDMTYEQVKIHLELPTYLGQKVKRHFSCVY